MGLRYMPPRGECGTPRLRRWRGFLSAALLSLAMLAGLPPEAKAQNSQHPPVSVQNAKITEGGTITFMVSRSDDSSQALTVNYATHDSEHNRSYKRANSPADFTATSGIITFAANETGSNPITVQTIQDTEYEAKEEEFILRLSGIYNGNNFEVDALGIIEEDDRVTLTLTPDPINIIEGETQTLTFTLSEPVPHKVRIGINDVDHPNSHRTATRNVPDGGATMADYTWSFQEVIIEANTKTGTIDITAIDDNVAEPDEVFELEFQSFNRDSGNTLGNDYNKVYFKKSGNFSEKSKVTIKDDDQPSPGKRIVYLHGGDQRTQVELEEGTGTTVTATLVGEAPSSDIEIPITATVYPAEDGWNNFTLPDKIQIKAGQKSGNVRLETTRNPTDDRHYTLLAVEIDEGRLPNDYKKGDRSRFEVIIEDTTPTKVTLSAPASFSLSEDPSMNNKATFEIEMSRPVKAPPSGGAPFSYDVVEPNPKFVFNFTGKASHGSDYKVGAIKEKVLSIPGDCTSWDKKKCTVELTVVDDDLYEATEMAMISLSRRANENNIPHINTSGKLALTINDNDPQPMLSVSDVTATEGGTLAFEVKRTGAMENTLSVRVATADDGDGTDPATARSDYATRSGMLEFGKNKLKQTFEVTTIQDVIDEPNETFLVMLSDAKDTGGEPKPGIEDDTATGTITDDDAAPTALEITVDTDADTDGNQATIAEAADKTTVHVTATIDSPTRFATDQTVTVTVGKQGDGAVEGTDYAEVAGTIEITIPATEASGKGTFELTPVNDGIDEDDETLSVEGALTGMTVTQADITIKDDDTRGITVTPTTLTIDEADNPATSDKEENKGTYEVALTSQPEGGTVTVDITNPGPTVATADPSSLTFDADNWEMAQTVTMIAKDDTIDDTGNQKTTTITHTVSAADTDYKDETVEDVEVTVLDNDEAPTALKITVDTDTDTADDQNTISEGADKP